jgi:hypothetical protein
MLHGNTCEVRDGDRPHRCVESARECTGEKPHYGWFVVGAAWVALSWQWQLVRTTYVGTVAHCPAHSGGASRPLPTNRLDPPGIIDGAVQRGGNPKTIERRHAAANLTLRCVSSSPSEGSHGATKKNGRLPSLMVLLTSLDADPPDNDHLALPSRTWVGEGLEEARRQIKPFWQTVREPW